MSEVLSIVVSCSRFFVAYVPGPEVWRTVELRISGLHESRGKNEGGERVMKGSNILLSGLGWELIGPDQDTKMNPHTKPVLDIGGRVWHPGNCHLL